MDSVYVDTGLLCRVPPFRNLRINAYLQLPEAYRSLSRLSSAPDAKAFPLYSLQLDLVAVVYPQLKGYFSFWSPLVLKRKVRIMQASFAVSTVVIVTLLLLEVPQLKFLTSLLLALIQSNLISSCSVFKVQVFLSSFKDRFEYSILIEYSNPSLIGGPEWARTTDLPLIRRTL